jgi:hypothetical protein
LRDEGSLIIVKENTCEDGPDGTAKEFLDEEDSSLTRYVSVLLVLIIIISACRYPLSLSSSSPLIIIHSHSPRHWLLSFPPLPLSYSPSFSDTPPCALLAPRPKWPMNGL